MNAKEVYVIGGGIAGVTSAYQLAKRGYQVTVLDSRGVFVYCNLAQFRSIMFRIITIKQRKVPH